MNRSMFIDAVGMVDADLIEAYVLKDAALRRRKRGKTKRYLVTLLAAAIALMLTFALLITSLPLVYVTNREEIDSAVTDAIDRVIFPLDDEDADYKQEDLLLNWTEWPITEQVFNALGAGTDHSIIEWMNGEHGGLAGEIWQRLGELLEKLYEYYQKHHDELDLPPDEIESETETETKTESESETETESEIETEQQSDAIDMDYTEGQIIILNPWGLMLRYEEGTFAVAGLKEKTSPDNPITIEIPEKVNSVSVTSIDAYAFWGQEGLESMIVPDSVTKIGEYAFAGCQDLRYLRLPNALYQIPESLCEDCTLLEEVVMPQSTNVIGKNAFANNVKLQSVNLPDDMHGIFENAFTGCTSLAEIEIPKNVESIGEGAFDGCSSLRAVALPNTLTTIEKEAFANCEVLCEVEFPQSLTTIESHAFQNTGLQSVMIPSSVVSMGDGVFESCQSLTYFEIEEGTRLKNISGLNQCSALERVLIPEGPTYISNMAFGNCESLKSIVIPASVTMIGPESFVGCTSLWSVIFAQGGAEAQGLTILNDTFRDCTALQQLVLPNHLIKLGEYAFAGCTGLQEVLLPQRLTDLSCHAFYNCSGLVRLEIYNPDMVYSYEFSGCDQLTEVIFKGTLSQLNTSIFRNLPKGAIIRCTDGEIIIE